MEIDPNNPVVKLCAEGIAAEMAGRIDDAEKLYQDAWNAKTDDYEACMAAHYVARVQKTPSDSLFWNSESLRYAEGVNDARAAGFYPSLYLNLGKAHEDLGNPAEAEKFYLLAESNVGVLGEGSYAETVRRGVANGLARLRNVGG
jgi:hypothetical protein